MANKVLLVGSYPPIMIHQDVAVVGSAITLMGRGFGRKIDKHSEVIRFNFAKTKGYEKDVGSKETIRFWTLTERRLEQIFPHDRKQMEREIIECTRDVPILISWLHLAEIKENGEFYGRKDEVYGLRFNKDKFKQNHRLTLDKPARTGMMMLMALIDSGIRPHVYGFSTGTKGASHPAHYFRKGSMVPTDGYHNVIQEEEIVKILSKRGLITLHECEVKA